MNGLFSSVTSQSERAIRVLWPGLFWWLVFTHRSCKYKKGSQLGYNAFQWLDVEFRLRSKFPVFFSKSRYFLLSQAFQFKNVDGTVVLTAFASVEVYSSWMSFTHVEYFGFLSRNSSILFCPPFVESSYFPLHVLLERKVELWTEEDERPWTVNTHCEQHLACSHCNFSSPVLNFSFLFGTT